MQDQPDHDATARRAYEIWEAEGRPEGRHEEHWRKAESGNRKPSDLTYSEIEQPGEGHPADDSGLPEASEQAGEGNPDPSSRDPGQRTQGEGSGQRVEGPEASESEALLGDGEPAGRPGQGIYAGP